MKPRHPLLCNFQPRVGFYQKAERILGWKPEISFEDSMKSTHERAKEQGLIKK